MSFSELHCEVSSSHTPILSPASACVQEATPWLVGWLASRSIGRSSPGTLPRALPRPLVERICPRLADPTRMAIRIRHIDELREARARLVAAYDAVQRRVERALHDGVQQDLTAVSVRLQLLRRLLPGDAADATELLDEIVQEVRVAADEVRRLAAEIYPSLLELWGLGPALRDATAASGGRATLETVRLGRYPPEIELAAYRLCLAVLEEAADTDTSIAIHIEEHEQSLRLAIDGPRSAVPRESAQLALARDRIESLGGVVSVAQRAGGARLAATLPL